MLQILFQGPQDVGILYNWCCLLLQDTEPVITDTYTVLPKDSTCDNLAAPAPYLPSAGGLAPAPSAASSSSSAG